jgi:hypothetical protein
MKMTDEVFDRRKDRHYFTKITKKIRRDADWFNLLVSCFKENQSLWVGEIWDNIETMQEKQENWEATIVDLPRTFETESRALVTMLLDEGHAFNEHMPRRVYRAYERGIISIEVFIVWKKLFKLEEKLLDILNYRYGYGLNNLKYESLLNVDINKFKGILETIVKEK